MSTTIFELDGVLRTQSPMHIGADADGNAVDMVQFVDGQGRITIPGTSLAGALRSAMGSDADDTGWGSGGRTGVHSLDGRASNITVFDAPARNSPTLILRTQVAIDRNLGTAADQYLYTRQLVPSGIDFDVRIIVETRAGYSAADALDDLTRIVHQLSSNGFSLGAATSQGLGEVKLLSCFTVKERSLTKDSIQAAVFGTMTRNISHANDDPIPAGTLRITVPWTPLGAVMSKVELDGGVVNACPLAEKGADGKIHMVIPGSSVKGMLRSHAERIARVAAGIKDIDEKFIDQMKDRRLACIGDLFGLAADEQRPELPGRRGVLTCREVRTAAGAEPSLWNAIRGAAADAMQGPAPATHNVQAGATHGANLLELANKVTDFNNACHEHGLWLDVISRNSIDRWTGGTADGRLFSTIEPHADWTPIVLNVDIARLRSRARDQPGLVDAALALVLFTLIDACSGLLSLGFGTTRGLGAFTVDPEQVAFANGSTASTEQPDPGLSPPGDHADGFNGKSLSDVLGDPGLLDTLSGSWTRIVTLSQETIDA